MLATAIIAEAREWLGTPWRHQAALKGIGCDCIGLVRGVARPHVGEVAIPLDYSATWPLYRAEERLRDGLARYANAIEAAAALPGDVLIFGIGRGPAHHCGFLAEGDRLIHAYREAGRVVEQDLTGFWREKLRGVFRVGEIG